ncbi:hypothetical protein ACC870_37245, partial [Rhizobium ruizarguesonis]
KSGKTPSAILEPGQISSTVPRSASRFNLAGEERMGRVADYARAFDIARDAGLGLTIHAGEVCGAFSVADALDAVSPSRIGHGVRAIEDLDLVK